MNFREGLFMEDAVLASSCQDEAVTSNIEVFCPMMCWGELPVQLLLGKESL